MFIICEKNSVAQSFAEALGATKQKGYYQNSKGDIITYCQGHLYELVEPDYYLPENTDKRTIDYLPIIPSEFKYQKIAYAKNQTAIVNELLRKYGSTEEIVIATDADREGELIARTVMRESKAHINYSRCKRFWTSESLTPSVIQKALQKMKPLSDYNNLAANGYARQHADWICGMNLSRYVTIGNTDTFSVGRVQTAILAAIARRNKDIENFVPQKYYELQIIYTDAKGNKAEAFLINPETKKTAFNTPDNLKLIIEELKKSELKPNYRKAEKRIGSPHLLSFTVLAKIAADKYDYTTQQTLEVAQKLYEEYKCLSYPRTNGTVLGEDNVDVFIEAYKKTANQSKWKYLCKEENIVNTNKKIFNSKKISTENHHALIPLAPLPGKATEMERNVYNIVLKTFLQSIMDDFLYEEIQMILTCGKHTLKSLVKIIKGMGWKESEPDEDLRTYVNDFNPDGPLKAVEYNILDKYTQPKKQFTESSLLTFMENPTGEEDEEKLVSLGTEATRGAIIEKLFEMKYCEKRKKNFFVTKKGFYLLDFLMKDEDLRQIASIAQTTKWERELAEDPAKFEKSINDYIRKCIKPKGDFIKYEKENYGICPVCKKGTLQTNTYYYYCNNYKNGCKFSIPKKYCGTNIPPAELKKILEGGETKPLTVKSKAGNTYRARLYLEKENNVMKVKAKYETKNKR